MSKKSSLVELLREIFKFDPRNTDMRLIGLIILQTFSILNAMPYCQADNEIKDHSADKKIHEAHKHTKQHSNTPELIIAGSYSIVKFSWGSECSLNGLF